MASKAAARARAGFVDEAIALAKDAQVAAAKPGAEVVRRTPPIIKLVAAHLDVALVVRLGEFEIFCLGDVSRVFASPLGGLLLRSERVFVVTFYFQRVRFGGETVALVYLEQLFVSEMRKLVGERRGALRPAFDFVFEALNSG